jgi:hypothetical protein
MADEKRTILEQTRFRANIISGAASDDDIVLHFAMQNPTERVRILDQRNGEERSHADEALSVRQAAARAPDHRLIAKLHETHERLRKVGR